MKIVLPIRDPDGVYRLKEVNYDGDFMNHKGNPVSSKTNWSNDERTRLQACMKHGKAWVDTAVYVGRSVDACKTMARKLRIEALPDMTPETIADLVGMYNDHEILVRDIAQEFSITAYQVREIAFANGCTARGAGSSMAWQKKEKPYKQKITPWPEGVRFEDHPKTVTNRVGGRYIRGEA